MILHDENLGTFMFMPYTYSVFFTSLKQHRDSWLESKRCSTIAFKIEINLHDKINTGYHLPAVKVIPDIIISIMWNLFSI